MHTAPTEGIEGSDGSGRTAFAHIATTLPGVSTPSSVVRSMHRTARSSAQSFEAFLIERVARPAARSSRPTASTPTVLATSAVAAAAPKRSTRSRSVGVDVGTGIALIWRGHRSGPMGYGPNHTAPPRRMTERVTAGGGDPRAVGLTTRSPMRESTRGAPWTDRVDRHDLR